MGLGLASASPRRASASARAIHHCSSRSRSRVAEGLALNADIEASIEERIDKGLRVEGDKIFRRLAGADKAHGQAEFAHDGHNDAAVRGAVKLGEDDAGDAGGGGELAGLREAVLSGGGVEDEQDVVRGAGNELGGGALHLFEL